MDSTQLIVSQLSGDALSSISSKLGVDESQAQQAIGLALPALIGALNRNTSQEDGAQALLSALTRDHDGSILENVSQKAVRPETLKDGAAILGHVFGEKETAIENSLGAASGLDAQTITQLLSMLAPIVLGILGQRSQEQELDAAGLAGLLQTERNATTSALPGIAQLLDFDGDGDISNDVISLGSQLLGGLFKKKN